jgi:hypothetical protein
MAEEKQERAAKAEVPAGPEESTEQAASQRESFSTLVSGAGASQVGPEPSLVSAAPPPRPFVFPPAKKPERLRPSAHARGIHLAEDFEDDTPTSRPVLLAEQIGPHPPSSAGSVRLSLTGTGRNLRGVRVALLDIDPTRTDALATALRLRQAEVHVTSFEGDRVHIRLLRKFAPHALLIDEGVLGSVGKKVIERLRCDPFLSHMQLFPLRFERMYNRRVGVASIETVRECLEPLGRAESELLARLGPHVEVEFELDQFPPHRLLRMLATRAAPTTIQCTREKEMLRWTVVRGRTGHAELYRLGVDVPQRLTADEALDWFLGHQNCHVVLTQPTEFDDKTGREVIPMVERQESGLWEAPEPKRGRASKRDPDSLSPQLLGYSDPDAQRSRFFASRFFSMKGRESSGLGEAGLASTWLGSSSSKWVFGAALGAAAAFAWSGMPGASENTKPGAEPVRVDADTLAQAAEGAPPSAPVNDPEATVEDPERAGVTAPKADPAPSAEPAPPAAPQAETKEPPGALLVREGAGLFAVPSQKLASCETLGRDVKIPSSVTSPAQVARLSAQHFRAAQKLLVLGRTKEAHADLCRAALLDPAGPGALVLVQYLLAERDYEQALRWMKDARAARPGELEVEELWGDVLHQAGHPEEALGVWLSALGMERDQTEKRAAVARRWAAHGAKSLSGGDYGRAERALRRASAFDPKSALVARILSTLFSRQGLAEQAARFRAEEARLAQNL